MERYPSHVVLIESCARADAQRIALARAQPQAALTRAQPGFALARVRFEIPAALLFFALVCCALVAGCGASGALDVSSSDDLTHQLAGQSLTHGTARAAAASNFSFSGKAGDQINPDVWPTGGAANSLLPKLELFGPADASGKRPLLAAGEPVDLDPSHLSLQISLPQSGIYLLAIGAQSGHEGRFSLRFWTSGSHAPRPESMQVSLSILPSDALENGLAPHALGGSRDGVAWSSDEVDALVAIIRAESDLTVAISDSALLYSTMAAAHLNGLATDALVEKAEHIGADRLGDTAAFAALPSSGQTLALYWLGVVEPAVFKTATLSNTADKTGPLAAIDSRISALVASWSGAVEVSSARQIVALSRDGVVYGYSATWQALLLDSDGKTQVFSWQSNDFFGADGTWLGESSLGALEPDDG